MKIRPVTAELFRAVGRTDGHDEANSRFSQFFLTIPKASQLMLYGEIISVCTEIH